MTKMKMEWLNRLRRTPWATPLAIAGPLGLSIGFLGIQNLPGQDDATTQPPASGTPVDPVDRPPASETTSSEFPPASADTLPSLVAEISQTTIVNRPRSEDWAPPSGPAAPSSPRPPVDRHGQHNEDVHVGWGQPPGVAPAAAFPAQAFTVETTAPFPSNPNFRGFGQFGQQNGLTVAYGFASDPEDQKLTQQSNNLANKLRDRSLEEDEIAKLKTQLKDLLNEQFELRQSKRQKELEKLKKEVANLEKSIDERSKKQAEIVDRRMAQLIGEPDELGWEYPNQPNYNGRFPSTNFGAVNVLPAQPPAPFNTQSGFGFQPATMMPNSQLPELTPVASPPTTNLFPMPASAPERSSRPDAGQSDLLKRIEKLEEENRRLKSTKNSPVSSTRFGTR